jgi:hypothetical protein
MRAEDPGSFLLRMDSAVRRRLACTELMARRRLRGVWATEGSDSLLSARATRTSGGGSVEPRSGFVDESLTVILVRLLVEASIGALETATARDRVEYPGPGKATALTTGGLWRHVRPAEPRQLRQVCPWTMMHACTPTLVCSTMSVEDSKRGSFSPTLCSMQDTHSRHSLDVQLRQDCPSPFELGLD